MLEIKNITKKFGDHRILNNINMTLHPGTVSILLGKSGGGKSTLLRILNNLEAMNTGSVFFNEKFLDLKTVQKNHLVGMVFQHFSLFKNLSVAQNITIVLEKVLKYSKAKAEKKTAELLTQFNLQKLANVSTGSLSGGQKQRLAIARAVAVSPKILCMDEPTSALDPIFTKSIAMLINNLAQSGYSVLVATHDMSLVENLQGTIFLMEDGTIKQSAKTDDFFHSPRNFNDINNFVQGITADE